MARKPRIHIPGGVYHVMLRGNGGQAVFFDDEDREYFLWLVSEGVKRFDHRIHAFCLMDNHIHFAIQVGEQPLSKIMQNLAFRYTRWVNKKQQRIGHLFQGRYKAIMVDQDSYLLELMRYIHLNPVRAGLFKQPHRYRWSGHRAYLGLEKIDWLHTDWVLSQFGKRRNTCQSRYAEFVKEGTKEGYREEFHKGSEQDTRVLGPDRFVNKTREKSKDETEPPTLNKIIETVCQQQGLAKKQLVAKGRNRTTAKARSIVAWLVYRTNASTIKALGDHFGRDATTLIRQIQQIDKQREDDRQFKRLTNSIYNTVIQA